MKRMHTPRPPRANRLKIVIPASAGKRRMSREELQMHLTMLRRGGLHRKPNRDPNGFDPE